MIQFPSDGITAQELFEYWLNIMDPPSRYFCEVLSNFVEDKQKAEKLREFSSKTAVRISGNNFIFRKANRSITDIV